MSEEQVYCYVGIKPCGCSVAAIVDRQEWKKDTAKEVAKLLRDGLSVERWTVERVRTDLQLKCEHGKLKDQLNAEKETL